jgi:ribosome-associated toxin RatA of RatAB toxin-antitoxin module
MFMSIEVRVEGWSPVEPTEAFRRLADYERYPEQTPSVRSVQIERRGADLVSVWRVDFRGGILCWTERDVIDEAALRLDFEQIDGDLELFTGGWRVLAEVGRGGRQGSLMIFTAELDLGIPSLAPLVDPMAESALRANMTAVLTGLFDDVVVAEPSLSRARS